MSVPFSWKLFIAVCLGTTIGTYVGMYLYYEGPSLSLDSPPPVEIVPVPVPNFRVIEALPPFEWKS
jgi:hypothetical protein